MSGVDPVKTAFFDTSGFYAFPDRDDRFHAEAKRFFLKPKIIPHYRLGTVTAGKSYAAVGRIGAPTSPSAHNQP